MKIYYNRQSFTVSKAENNMVEILLLTSDPMVNFIKLFFAVIGYSRAPCYKTLYIRKLQIFVIG
jgi:hypothetical protein